MEIPDGWLSNEISEWWLGAGYIWPKFHCVVRHPFRLAALSHDSLYFVLSLLYEASLSFFSYLIVWSGGSAGCIFLYVIVWTGGGS